MHDGVAHDQYDTDGDGRNGHLKKVLDAVSRFGTRHVTMLLSPEAVFAPQITDRFPGLIQQVERGGNVCHVPLHCSFAGKLEYLPSYRCLFKW